VNERTQGNDGGLYRSPFVTRWAGQAMLRNWSEVEKVRLWRSLWIALAEAERELGLDIPAEAIEQMRRRRDEVDLAAAARLERELRHDVMAHVRLYGEQCPAAKGIIHLGATSCFVTDNADLVRIRRGLRLLLEPLAAACRHLADFARRHKDLPCLGYTHFQPAQLTTVGKRACLWLQDMLWDLEAIEHLARQVAFRGVRGATGTQASFLELFDGDEGKVRELERRVAQKMGFSRLFPVTGQTYPRKFDHRVLCVLAGVGVSAHKMACDVRLLAGLKELEEPFGKSQVGSSAMPYKRNPMRSERMASLARFLINNAQNAAFTAAEQWLERRRLRRAPGGEHQRRAGGERGRHSRPHRTRAPLHGRREHPDAGREGRRGPSGAARTHPRALDGRGAEGQTGGRAERPAGAHRRRSGVRRSARAARADRAPRTLRRPRAAPGGTVP